MRERAVVAAAQAVDAAVDAARERPDAPSRVRKRAHSIGTSESATNIEITIATASEIANSRNSRPVSPLISESGTSTATSAAVVAITGKPTSREP